MTVTDDIAADLSLPHGLVFSEKKQQNYNKTHTSYRHGKVSIPETGNANNRPLYGETSNKIATAKVSQYRMINVVR